MLVFENGDTLGTIGGGSAECLAAKDAMECICTGENAFKIYDLSSAATNNTGMTCGGHIKVLIESFPSKPLLVMCGAGYVGCAVLKVAGFMGYSTLLIDDRADEIIDKSIAVADRFVRVKDFERYNRNGYSRRGIHSHSHSRPHKRQGVALRRPRQKPPTSV